MSDGIRIVEVGPRDGLQNEKLPIPVAAKLRYIRSLVQSGLHDIEASSFVSPRWVPQLADAIQLWPGLPPKGDFSALIPNKVGLDRALELGVRRIAVFTAASEAFSRHNVNMTIGESMIAIDQVIEAFHKAVPNGWVRGYVSTAFECPYEGRIEPRTTVMVAQKLLALGVNEVSIGDTLGVAVPKEVKALTKMLEGAVPLDKIAYHFHDTRGTAIANVSTALDMGVRVFDSSAGGLGGCPYAPGAGGNLATEDLVYFLERSGYDTKIDLYRLAQASLEILQILGRNPSGKSQLAQLSASGTFPI